MYFLIRDNNIFGYQELPMIGKDVTMVIATENQDKNVKEYGLNYYKYYNGDIVYNENYEKEKEQERRDYIDSLHCTKRVFALALKEFGITYSKLKELIATSEDAQLEWDLCVELQRSNPLLNTFGEILGITPEQIDLIFLFANGDVDSLEVNNE